MIMIYMYVYIVINLNIFEEKGSREQIWFYYLVERIQPEKLFQIMKFICIIIKEIYTGMKNKSININMRN